MKRRRKSVMGRKLQKLAADPGVIDPIHINVWTEADGVPRPEPGRHVKIAYHRADGRKFRQGRGG